MLIKKLGFSTIDELMRASELVIELDELEEDIRFYITKLPDGRYVVWNTETVEFENGRFISYANNKYEAIQYAEMAAMIRLREAQVEKAFFGKQMNFSRQAKSALDFVRLLQQNIFSFSNIGLSGQPFLILDDEDKNEKR